MKEIRNFHQFQIRKFPWRWNVLIWFNVALVKWEGHTCWMKWACNRPYACPVLIHGHFLVSNQKKNVNMAVQLQKKTFLIISNLGGGTSFLSHRFLGCRFGWRDFIRSNTGNSSSPSPFSCGGDLEGKEDAKRNLVPWEIAALGSLLKFCHSKSMATFKGWKIGLPSKTRACSNVTERIPKGKKETKFNTTWM